jgi:hypothetical protein
MSQRNPQRPKCNSVQEWAAPRRRRRIPHRLLLAAAACYCSAASTAEYSSLRPRACSRLSSFALLPVEGSAHHVWGRLRAGGGGDGDGEQNVPPDGDFSSSSSHEASSYDIDKADTSSDSSTAESSAALRLTSLVPSLFQMNNNVKFDASLDDDDRDGDLTTAPSDSARSSSFTRSTSTNGRGGAMLVKPKAPPRRIFQWLAPLETDRVAPLADRLIVDDGGGDASAVRTVRNNDPSTHEPDAAAKPTSYVPYRANSQWKVPGKDGQPTETSLETEAPHEQSSQDDPGRVQSTEVTHANGDVTRSSAQELEVDVGETDEINDDAHATQLHIISHGSTAEIDAEIVPETPYVSSGYVSVQNAE